MKKIIRFLRRITRKPKGKPTIPRQMVIWLCEHTGGHEQAPGEVGYSGGGMLDVWCKHCDYMYQVPIKEKDVSNIFHDLMGLIPPERKPL